MSRAAGEACDQGLTRAPVIGGRLGSALLPTGVLGQGHLLSTRGSWGAGVLTESAKPASCTEIFCTAAGSSGDRSALRIRSGAGPRRPRPCDLLGTTCVAKPSPKRAGGGKGGFTPTQPAAPSSLLLLPAKARRMNTQERGARGVT